MPPTSNGICLFTSQSRPLAVEMGSVDVVVEWGELVPIPLGPPHVLGFRAWRRDVVPVVQATGPYSYGADVGESSPLIFLLRTRQGPWGLRVDRGGVEVIDDQNRRTDSSTRSGIFATCGSIERAGTTHEILDVERTWQNLRSEIEGWYATSRAGSDRSINGTARPTRATR